MKLLSLQIPTVVGREDKCEYLVSKLRGQLGKFELKKSLVEIIIQKDNKEISIGAKRQLLLERCNAEYFVQIDDDDSVSDYYLYNIVMALQSKPDCVGYLELCNINGIKKLAAHSNKYKDWANGVDGYDFVRTIFCKDVIKTSIAKQIGFKDIRYGEDYDFSKRLKQSGLLKNEYFINNIMYYYSHNNLTQVQHKERYGITE